MLEEEAPVQVQHEEKDAHSEAPAHSEPVEQDEVLQAAALVSTPTLYYTRRRRGRGGK